MIKKRKQNPIMVLGEVIDPDNMPILYQKAKNHKPELERQLKSLSESLKGSVRASIINLENDLEHG
ncbi:MAG: hypothetical protein NTV24_04905 [Candidatus Woesebacteria bacterium]|nr:hypothetical protein [Candidatus Woesebacteria bacterium]